MLWFVDRSRGAGVGWGTRDLARNANVSPDSIARLERGEHLKSSTIDDIRQTFQSASIEFISKENGVDVLLHGEGR
nr:transcriptional regulator [[Ochrobactrum] quorumnocens]